MRRNPLDVEEIFDLILASIDEPPALAACLRVNKRWFIGAVRWLWQGQVEDAQSGRFVLPSIEYMHWIANANPANFRYYASSMRCLVLRSGETPRDTPALRNDQYNVEAWKAVKPRYVLVKSPTKMNKAAANNINKEFVVVLRLAHSFHFKEPASSLADMISDYTSLQGLEVSIRRGTQIGEQGVLAILQNQPQLKFLRLSSRSGNWDFDCIADFVLTRPELRVLWLGGNYSAETVGFRCDIASENVQRLNHVGQRILPSCQSLTLEIGRSPAVRELLYCMTNTLEHVHLFSNDGDDEIDIETDLFMPLARCSYLTEVNMFVDGIEDSDWPDRLSALAEGCPRMQSFDFRATQVENYPPTGNLVNVLKHWPCLRLFASNAFRDRGSWRRQTALDSTNTLQDIAGVCPRLQKLDVPINVNLPAWSSSNVFRHLHKLSVRSLVQEDCVCADGSFESSISQRLFATLDQYMPRVAKVKPLQRFYAIYDLTPWEERNHDALKEHLIEWLRARAKSLPPAALSRYVGVEERLVEEICEG